MSDNLLDAALDDETPKTARPDDVPEKFWDDEKGELRLDALLKSYRELERRMSQRAAPPAEDADPEERARFLRALGVPETPEGYEIAPKHELCGPDAEINRRLHEAGFTCRQAQLVYDLAAERLLPLIAEAASEYESQRQLARLTDAFGGEKRFRRVAKQISAWGRQNLAPGVFDALSTSFEGVMAMQRMMEKGEPALARKAEPEAGMDEASLRKMMQDPRYWRSRDPDFVRRVTDGFRRLVGG